MVNNNDSNNNRKDEKPNAVNIRVFKKVISLYTAFEQKWLIRIILKGKYIYIYNAQQ